MFCPHCMQKVSSSYSHCPVCGGRLDVHNEDTRLSVGTVIEGSNGHVYYLGKVVEENSVGPSYIACDVNRDMVVFAHECTPSYSSQTPMDYGAREASVEGFMKEGILLKRMTEDEALMPCIARMIDCFELGGSVYLISERIAGFTLEETMKTQSACEPTMFLRRAIRLAHDISSLHKAGVIHGGVSPRHVVCTTNGMLRLSWLGKGSLEEQPSAYSAIESCATNISNESRVLSPCTDVYGLCATIYYGLTGIEPISALERMRAKQQALPDPLVPLQELGVALPGMMDRSLMRGLVIMPEGRQQSMEELIEPLELCLLQAEKAKEEVVRNGMIVDWERCPMCMAPTQGLRTCPACGHAIGTYRAPTHHITPGSTLCGRYVVGVSLGEGGFGITYVGFDTVLDRKVAIKEYFPTMFASRDASDSRTVLESCGTTPGTLERGRERFLEEARTLARLGAGSISPIALDYFTCNGTAYIVMEKINGVMLREFVQQCTDRLSMDDLVDLLEPVFIALSELHEAKLIHRDVTPDNIVVNKGVARLVDYGIVGGYEEAYEQPIALNLDYAPPEQFSTGGYGPWTDVFTLCATMYECLTNQKPPNSLARLSGDRLVPASELGAQVSTEQELALMRGLSLMISERFQSVAELHTALCGQ